MPEPEEVAVLESADSALTKFGPIWFPRNDAPIGAALRAYGEWAGQEITFLSRLLGGGDHCLDIGANVGTHSLAFASKVGERGKVISIEPQHLIFQLLSRTITSNRITAIESLNAAVGETEGTTSYDGSLSENQFNYGATRMVDGERDLVSKITIDGLSLVRCDFAKIDVEGGGYQVLQGMAGTIERHTPVLYCECNTVEEGYLAYSFLQGSNYRLFVVECSAYNPSNYYGNASNFFGWATETALLALPLDRELPAAVAGVRVTAIESVDELAAAILAAPRHTDSSPLSRDIGAALRALSRALRREHEGSTREAALQSKVEFLLEEVGALRNSRSWRITAPLRKWLSPWTRDMHHEG